MLRAVPVAAVAALVVAGAIAAQANAVTSGDPSATPEPAPQTTPTQAPAHPGTPHVSVSVESEAGGALPVGQLAYDKFLEHATKQAGLFTLWHKDGRLYIELAPDQFDRPYLVAPSLAGGVGSELFAGLPFNTLLFQFHRDETQVVTSELNPYAQAAPGSPAAVSVAESYPQSVIGREAVTSIDAATGRIVFPADVFLSDIVDLADQFDGSLGSIVPGTRYHLDTHLSYFGQTKSFPDNIDVEADLTLSSFAASAVDDVPDSRSLFVRMHYSVARLPDDGYRPRYADDRVGYFITARRQYDRQDTQTSFVRYIERWNIQKSDANAKMSPAKHPIVYYISNDVPVQYRRPIRDALLTWNRAFEAIGITHAIDVRQQPNDPAWDPDDVRYSVVRWVVSPSGAFVYGPSFVNPLNGEIFRSEIVIDGNILRVGQVESRDFVAPLSAALRTKGRLRDAYEYGFGSGEAQQLRWATIALAGLSGGNPSASASGRLVTDFLESVVLHESGHNLGLRHNFEASAAYSLAKVHDRAFTRVHGVASSVMDYAPLNLSPRGKPQGDYFQTVLGPYDYFAIRYGYEPLPARSAEAELPALASLASRASSPWLAYGTDEDADWYSGFATDPRIAAYDLSSDPLGYADEQFGIDRRLMSGLPSYWPRPGHSYVEASDAFGIVLYNWYTSAQIVTHFAGAEYFSRAHRGDPSAPPPLVPVPRAQERRAFDLLDRNVFGDDALTFPPNLLTRLGDDRFEHWESDANQLGSLDFPAETYVEFYQQLLLGQMWQPSVLRRLDLLANRESQPGQTMTLADLFDWTDETMWSDLAGATRSVPAVHRALQQHYAALLVHIMLRPDFGTPGDARALARRHLTTILRRIDGAIARRGFDEPTAANFVAIRSEIAQALDARYVL